MRRNALTEESANFPPKAIPSSIPKLVRSEDLLRNTTTSPQYSLGVDPYFWVQYVENATARRSRNAFIHCPAIRVPEGVSRHEHLFMNFGSRFNRG